MTVHNSRMYVARQLEESILDLSRSYPVLLLTGARQVGKTTLLSHLANHAEPRRTYVSLDEFGPRALARDEPELFLQRFPPPVCIDEIQQAPQLFPALKADVDRRSGHGHYWLSGSQQFSLMSGVAESLAGRVAILELFGFSQAEEAGKLGGPAFRPDRLEALETRGPEGLLPTFERIVRGAYPRFLQPDAPPIEVFYGSYIQTYIERDVRSLLNIENLPAFRRFLRIAAARVGHLLNFSDLARDTGVAVNTAKSWIALLEATYQVVLLRPYFENLGKRQVKTPKLYFLDTGLVCHLTGWTNAKAASAGAMAGSLLESYALAELIKSYRHRGREAPIWFYRTKEQQEVDFLIAEDGAIFPIEVKLTATPSRRDLRGITSLGKHGASLGPGAVLCMTESPFPITGEVEALPISMIG